MRIKIAPNDALWLALAGAVTGSGAALLTRLGNPVDGGISMTCFFRDIAGSLGLHQIIEFSYLRPEITAIMIGAFISALVRGHFVPTGSSSGIARFVIGGILSFGAFAFVGCPMRVGLRLAGGDPAALAGLAGLIAGVGTGTFFLRRGYSSGKPLPTDHSTGFLFHTFLVLIFIMLLVHPSFLILANQRHAPLWAALIIGAIIGVLGQQSKLCFIGGFRNLFLIGDYTLLTGFVATVLSAMITNTFLGQAHWGIHIIGLADLLWSFLALTVVGLASVFLGGCPFRLLILASQGNTDAVLSILGITAGAAISYNYGFACIAGSLDIGGKIMIGAGLLGLVLFGILQTRQKVRL
jgi:YedE family putative selenium metabolism protein